MKDFPFQADLAVQYVKAGVKGIGLVFLMTDAQVAEEKFLVVINDCLASGEVPELFADDEIDNIINNMRTEVILNSLFILRYILVHIMKIFFWLG